MSIDRYRRAEQELWAFYGCTPGDLEIQLAATGTRVRVQEIGEGDPVLFIHGGPNAGTTWAPLAAHLDAYRCLLVDRPGTGLSESHVVTADRLPDLGASFVGDVLDGLGVDRAHVVASSFGGHLALRSAAAHPERLLRMVQMAAPAAVPGQVFPPFMNSLKSSLARQTMNILPPSRRINRSIMRQIGHGASLDAGRIPEAFFDWYYALGRHTETMRLDGRMIGAEILPNLDSLTLSKELLGSVVTPTLFVWGADDGFGGEENAQLVTAMMPEAELLMMPDAGHLPWLDDPETAADCTRDFLSRSSKVPVESGDQSSGTER